MVTPSCLDLRSQLPMIKLFAEEANAPKGASADAATRAKKLEGKKFARAAHFKSYFIDAILEYAQLMQKIVLAVYANSAAISLLFI